MQTLDARITQIAGIVAAALLVAGCFLVLRPFFPAILWAGILCFVTWPLFVRLKRVLRGRRSLAALLMTCLLGLLVVLPFALVGLTLADNLSQLLGFFSSLREKGLPAPPEWIRGLPLAGDHLAAGWQRLSTDSDRTFELVRNFFATSQGWLLKNSLHIGKGLLQLVLSLVLAFFFYLSGEKVMEQISAVIRRLAGDTTQHLVASVGKTVKGVVYGILGTALAQGIVAAIGFVVAGVPGALFLGLLTFFLSLVPVGPPLVWVPVTVWLFMSERTGWGVFMLFWGFLAISGIDNLVKPYLIARGVNQPFIITLLGVAGGLLAFGFLGVFLGPTLLAAGLVLLREWIGGSHAARGRAGHD